MRFTSMYMYILLVIKFQTTEIYRISHLRGCETLYQN